MGYRDRTFVSFADQDLESYRLMQAWPASEDIAFNFHDAYELEEGPAGGEPAAVKAELDERLATAKQVVVLISDHTRGAAVRPSRLRHEVEAVRRAGLPVVFANLNGARRVQVGLLPRALTGQYTISVTFDPKMIKYALDDFVAEYPRISQTDPTPHGYDDHVYSRRLL